jgi:hypothetical protein
MKLLSNVVRSLKWKLEPVMTEGNCAVRKCSTKPDATGRLLLCKTHKKEYRARQHRLAQARVDARPLNAPRLKPLLKRKGKPTPWALANPEAAKKLRDLRA